MATYTKKLKTAKIYLMLNGQSKTISDTADSPLASMAIASFEKGEDMFVEKGNTLTDFYRYDAVQYIKVTESESEVEKADPYGCE